MQRRPFIGFLVVGVLLGAAVYEAAIALEWIAMGREPGDDPPGENIVVLSAIVALLLATGYFAAQLVTREVTLPRVASFIPVAAAAFVVARFHSFDPYYLPTLRRFSDGGSVADVWVYTLAACALVAGLVVKLLPRTGSLATAVLLPLLALTAFAVGLGH